MNALEWSIGSVVLHVAALLAMGSRNSLSSFELWTLIYFKLEIVQNV